MEGALTPTSLIIELTNGTAAFFSQPSVFMGTGQVSNPPPPTIPANQKAAFSFCKDPERAAYGVMAYDVFDCIHQKKAVCRLTIMFSVPYDRKNYSNEFGIGVVSPETPCDEKLLQAMYSGYDTNSKKQVANGGELSYKDLGYVIKGTMSQMELATMKLEIYKIIE